MNFRVFTENDETKSLIFLLDMNEKAHSSGTHRQSFCNLQESQPIDEHNTTEVKAEMKTNGLLEDFIELLDQASPEATCPASVLVVCINKFICYYLRQFELNLL